MNDPIDITTSSAFELDAWKVQVFGERCGRSWEISVVRDVHGISQVERAPGKVPDNAVMSRP